MPSLPVFIVTIKKEMKDMDINECKKELLKELNSVEIKQGTMYGLVGGAIHKYLTQIDAKKQRKVIAEIKKSEDLKLSPQFVYDCYRMVTKFPETAEEGFEVPVGLTMSHYFELSRYKLSPGVLPIILENCNGKSVNYLKEEVKKYREEKGVDIERESLLAKVRAKVNKLDIEQLRKADQFLFDLLETKK